MNTAPQEEQHDPTISFRIPSTTLKELDELVKKSSVGAARVTRTSLLLSWINRGIRESKRSR